MLRPLVRLLLSLYFTRVRNSVFKIKILNRIPFLIPAPVPESIIPEGLSK